MLAAKEFKTREYKLISNWTKHTSIQYKAASYQGGFWDINDIEANAFETELKTNCRKLENHNYSFID